MFGPPGPPSPIYHSLPHPLPVGLSTLWWWKYRKYYFFTASDTFRHSKLSPSRNFSFQFVSASKHTNILRNLFIILVIKTFAYLELCKMRNFVLPKVSRKFRVQFASSGTFPLCPPFLLYRGKNNQNHFSLFWKGKFLLLICLRVRIFFNLPKISKDSPIPSNSSL